jgi:hypothetical protein
LIVTDNRSAVSNDPVLLYGGIALALLGVLVTVWGLVDDRDTIVVFGLLSGGFGIVLGRLQGPFKLGPGGLEGNLPDSRARTINQAIARRLDELPLDDASKSDLTDFLTWKALRGLEFESLLSRSRTIEVPAATATARAAAPTVLIDNEASAEEVGMAASELADELVRENVRVLCDNGHPLSEPSDLPFEDRKPCPVCGSLNRQFNVRISDVGVGSRVVGVVHGSKDAESVPEAERDLGVD